MTHRTRALKVVILSDKAKQPVGNNDGSFELFSAGDHIIHPGDSATISTGLAMGIPLGYYALACSTKASEQYQIQVNDFCSINHLSDKYRNNSQNVHELFITLRNHGKMAYHVAAGSNIARLLLVKCSRFEVVEVQNLRDAAQSLQAQLQVSTGTAEIDGVVRVWVGTYYKRNPEECLEKFATPEILEAFETFKQTNEYQVAVKKKKALNIEAEFIRSKLMKDSTIVKKLQVVYQEVKVVV